MGRVWILGMAAAALLGAAPGLADDDGGRLYEVTIINVTKGQTFTPILVATHSDAVRLFAPGQPASPELEVLAEDGDPGPLSDVVRAQGRAVGDVTVIAGLLEPGQPARVRVRAGRGQRRISLAAMLIPTNDTFVSLNARLPLFGSTTRPALAWDAGTEENDQNCANIPGPRCGGEGHSPEPADGDEGHVHVSNGFHEQGSEDGEGNEILGPFGYDWRNPVAMVTIRRVR